MEFRLVQVLQKASGRKLTPCIRQADQPVNRRAQVTNLQMLDNTKGPVQPVRETERAAAWRRPSTQSAEVCEAPTGCTRTQLTKIVGSTPPSLRQPKMASRRRLKRVTLENEGQVRKWRQASIHSTELRLYGSSYLSMDST